MSLDDTVDAVLSECGNSAPRHDLIAAVGRHRFDNMVKTGRLVAVFPRVYSRPWDADLPATRLTAAVQSVGGEVALSHLTALAHWNLPVPADVPIHVTAFNPRHPRGVPGELVVHRTLLPLDAVEHERRLVVRPELAIATSWSILDGDDQRAPLIEAKRTRLVSASRIGDLAERMWWLAERASLRDLVGMMLAGCESPLELWGYTHVFNVPGLDDASRQLVVHVGDRTYRLDQAYEDEMLDVELDGAKYHSSPLQRERDVARDVALATVGWQTIRFPHHRLHYDVAGCRRDALAVRDARRRELAS